MRTRHRIPSIFNLSMVDVLCCALGCVILLWLLNLREAKQKADEAGASDTVLASTRSRLSDTEQQLYETARLLREITGQRDSLRAQRDLTDREREELRRQLDATLARLASLNKDAADLRTQKADAESRLLVLTRQKQDAADRLSVLEALLKNRDAAAAAESDRVKSLTDRLAAEQARAKDLQAQAGRAAGLMTEAEQLRGKLAVAEGEINARKKEIAQARAVADNRFAGIQLTGKRVVFLVDMSGSMELVDERTAAPTKWKVVCETLGKVMRSLPDLEKYQVILFSDRVLYPLGSEDRWLDYDPRSGADKALNALAAVQPRGNTNLFAAFQAAFRFKPAGMDTIYLLSDGLPNIGEGLSLETARTLKENERSEILSRYLRDVLKREWNPDGKGPPRVRINAVGFFYESPDVGAFLWALSRENDGSFVGMSKP